MVRRLALALLSLSILMSMFTPACRVSAAETPQPPLPFKNKGLYISPLRNYLSLDASTSVTRAFTVANRTDQPMTIVTSVEEFSVADYSYDYRFDETDNDWIKLVENVKTLKPFESHDFAYQVSVPKNAAPGGHYYTFFASSTTTGGATPATIRAASLLYLTVNGTLIRTSQVINRSLPWLAVSPTINYSLDIKNTGNIHFFLYTQATVSGLFYRDAPGGASQLLMPGTTRQVAGSIRSPLLPGIYKLNVTLIPDQGRQITSSQYFVNLPPWSIALIIIMLAIAGRLIIPRLRARRHKQLNTNHSAK